MKTGDVQGVSPFLAEAELLLGRGHFEHARRLAAERLAVFPSDLEGKIVLCRALLGMDNLESATPLIHEVERWIRCAARIYPDAGDSLARKGRSDEAAHFYRKYLSLSSGTPEAERISSRVHSLGNADQEGEAGPDGRYECVEEVDRQFWTVTLADLYVRQGHLDMARGVLEEILRRDPQHMEARNRLESLPEGDARSDAAGRKRLAGELARWLKNVDRLKTHGT